LLASVAIWAGCSSNSPPSARPRLTPVISKDARPLRDATATHATIKPTQLVFPLSDQSDLVGTEGKVLVSGVGDGFLRRVKTVTTTGDTVTVDTEDASLTDVVEQGETWTTFSLGDHPQVWRDWPGVRPQSVGPNGAGFEYPLTGKVLYAAEGIKVWVAAQIRRHGS
jgi:hypothetical protein